MFGKRVVTDAFKESFLGSLACTSAVLSACVPSLRRRKD